MNNTVDFVKYKFFLLSFFIFLTFYLVIRTILIGPHQADNAFEIIITALPDIFIFCISIYAVFLYRKQPDAIKIGLYDWLILSYIFINITYGSWIAHNIKLSLYAIRLTYSPMIFYFLGRLFILDPHNNVNDLLEKLFKWFAVFALLGIISYFIWPDKDFLEVIGGTDVINFYFIRRLAFVHSSPVLLGTIMTVSGIYIYSQIVIKSSLLRYIMFVIVWVCLLLTVSRGAIICFLFGILFLSYLYRAWLKFGLITLAMVISALLLGIVLRIRGTFYSWLVTSFVETATMQKEEPRVDLWRTSLKSFLNNLSGYGLGNAGGVAQRFLKDSIQTNASVASTDGWFLKLANETGIIGLFLYVTLAITFLVQSFKYGLQKDKNLVSFVIVVFIVVNIQNTVSNVLDFYLFTPIYWFLIATVQNTIQKKEYVSV